jgi:hypothetical protein
MNALYTRPAHASLPRPPSSSLKSDVFLKCHTCASQPYLFSLLGRPNSKRRTSASKENETILLNTVVCESTRSSRMRSLLLRRPPQLRAGMDTRCLRLDEGNQQATKRKVARSNDVTLAEFKGRACLQAVQLCQLDVCLARLARHAAAETAGSLVDIPSCRHACKRTEASASRVPDSAGDSWDGHSRLPSSSACS